MCMIRKGQVKGISKGDSVSEVKFIEGLFGISAQWNANEILRLSLQSICDTTDLSAVSWKPSCCVLKGGESGDARTLPDPAEWVTAPLSLTQKAIGTPDQSLLFQVVLAAGLAGQRNQDETDLAVVVEDSTRLGHLVVEAEDSIEQNHLAVEAEDLIEQNYQGFERWVALSHPQPERHD